MGGFAFCGGKSRREVEGSFSAVEEGKLEFGAEYT